MKKFALLTCSALFGAALLSGSATADPGIQDPSPPNISTITGAWQVEFTVRFDAADCTTSPPVPFGPNPFPSLNTFHAGGTFSETGSRSPPSRRSPGHGVWQRTGARSYEARYTFQGFDPNGFLATNMDIRSAITLTGDGDSFTGIARLNYSDISGNTQPFCATLIGDRFKL